MANTQRFLIIEGYPEPNRDQFNQVGMRLAWELYRDMLLRYEPSAAFDVWYAADAPTHAPADLTGYNGILWPGCSLTVYHDHDPRVVAQIDLVKRAYAVGIPQFGSCWGIQLAVHAAGGTVAVHPKGREMGIARKIFLTPAGRDHAMFAGKPVVYNHFVSHDDYVTELPDCATRLAGNAFCPVQAVEVKYDEGVFWGVQYHPEYDLHVVARLTMAREEKLVKQGFFQSHADLAEYVDRLEALAADPDRKDLRWQLGIDDDVLSETIRQCEFFNWLKIVR